MRENIKRWCVYTKKWLETDEFYAGLQQRKAEAEKKKHAESVKKAKSEKGGAAKKAEGDKPSDKKDTK